MKFTDQIMGWLGYKKLTSSYKARQDAVRELINQGQRAKRSEDYNEALQKFEQALLQAEEAGDHSATVVITLHRAEIYTEIGDWTSAENLLLQIRRSAQNHGQHTQMSYALSALGTLSQAKGDWSEARAYYEQALKVGQAAASLGAEARALGHLADTYLEEANASYAVHLLREAVPKLNVSGDLEPSSYFVGRLGESLIKTGQEGEGEHLLYRALRLAEQMQYRAYERRWSLALGARMLNSLHYEDALKHYQRALELFPADNHHAEKVTALANLSRAYLYLRQGEAALEQAQLAANEAQDLDDPGLKALAESALGMALRYNGQSVQAIDHLKNAANHLDEHSLQVELLRNLAAAQADIADGEAAISTYHRALELAQSNGTPPVDLAQTRVDLGLLYAQHRDMAAAVDNWTQALNIYTGERQFEQVARLHCDLANARKFLGQGQRALKEYQEALTTLNAVEDWSTRGVVLANAATAYADVGEIESAEAFFNEAITIASRMGDTAAEAIRRGNYGWFLMATNRPHKAVSMLEHALRISQQQDNKLQIAIQSSNLGRTHDLLEEIAAAWEYYELASQLIPWLHDPHWIAMLKIDIAQAMIQRENTTQARILLEEALATAREIGDNEATIGALTAQSQLLLLDHRPEAIGDRLSEAITLARRADMRRLLAGALRVQSQQQALLGNQEQAQNLWNEAQRLYTVLHSPEAEQHPIWLTGSVSPS